MTEENLVLVTGELSFLLIFITIMSPRFQLESPTFHGQIEFRISTFGSPKSNSISRREVELDVFISQTQLVGTAI